MRMRTSILYLAVVTSLLGVLPTSAVAGPGEAGAWSLTDRMKSWTARHTATRLDDGRVLVAGGEATVITGGAQLFHPEDGSWAPTRYMLTPRSRHAAAKLPDGRVLVVGGLSYSSFLASSEIWDPATGIWTAGPNMREARGEFTATALLDGRVLVVGGVDYAPVHRSSVEIYDPHTNRWFDAAPLHEVRARHTATLLADGRVLVAGGTTWRDGTGYGTLSTAEIYDPVADRWTAAHPSIEARSGHAAVRLPNGTVLVCGGANSGYSATVEIYDPSRDEWRPVAPMLRRRYGPASVLLADGRVLVAGGVGLGVLEAHTLCEIFDPTTETWSPAGSMSEARLLHTLTLLADGRVLVAGGTVSYQVGVAEVFTPGRDGPRIDSVEFRPGAGYFTEFVVRGAGFRTGAVVLHNRNAADDPARVSADGTELIQSGHLEAGKLVDEAFPPGAYAGLAVLNPDHTVAGLVAEHPYAHLTLTSVEVRKVRGKSRLFVHGTNLLGGARVYVDGATFTKPSRVIDGTTVEQRGKSDDGRSIDRLVPRGATVSVYVMNPPWRDGISISYTRP